MNKTNAQLLRKSGGKSFAIVDVPSRYIFAWHRKGDALPRVVSYEGKAYLLDQAAVDQAQVEQRVYLQEVEDKALAYVDTMFENRKGGIEATFRDSYGVVKAVAKLGAVAVAATGAAALVVDTVKGYL